MIRAKAVKTHDCEQYDCDHSRLGVDSNECKPPTRIPISEHARYHSSKAPKHRSFFYDT